MSDRRIKLIAVLVLLALAVAIPRLTTSFYVNLVSEVMIYGLLAMSIDILAGFTGLVPLGHAGIFGISAYVVGYLLTKTGTPVYIAIPLGITASTVAAAVFAVIAIRTSGVYFLMVTLAEGMIVWGVAYRWASVTGAENGIRGIARPELVHEYWQFYYLVLIVFVIVAAIMYRLVSSPFGLTLKGIRESESRMRTLGYNTTLHKFIGFTATGIFAGVGGGLYAIYNGFVSPSTVEFAKSAEGVLMTIVGGVGTLFGPVIGAIVIIFTRNIVSLYTSRWPTVMGLIFVVTILFARDGLVGGGRRLFNRILAMRRKSAQPMEEVVSATLESREKRETSMTKESELQKAP
jgi:branched-chain amino acid transport system permease protein